ncbi:MAG: GNAT family N-acetyltransferase [Anaerolineaceae bacterium]
MNQDATIQEKIKSCEIAYINCFSEHDENDQVIRYRDAQLPDMYDHNFSYIKHAVSKNAFRQLVEEEIEQNRREKKNFIKLAMDAMPDRKWLESLPQKFDIEHSGYYVYPSLTSPQWNTVEDCKISQVVNPAMIEELVFMDLIHDGERCGEDFCMRRARRRGRVYLSETPLDSYICYSNGNLVGNCDLFMDEDVAKIEDFAVLPAYQRRGIGTTILKYVIHTALTKGAELIYLMADEGDTPQEMYKKLGFEKIGDSYALFGKL